MGEGIIISFDAQMLFGLGLQLLNTLILFLVLSKLLFNPVRSFMQKRANKIQTQLGEAAAEEQKVMELKKEYEGKLANIQEEADTILRDARKKGLEREEQIITEAKKEAEVIHQRELSNLEKEQERVKDEMKKEMIEIASMIAGKFVASSMDQQTQDKLIGEVIDEMGDVTWLN